MKNKVIVDLLNEINDTVFHEFRLQLGTLINNLSHVYRNGTLPGEVLKQKYKKKSNKSDLKLVASSVAEAAWDTVAEAAWKTVAEAAMKPVAETTMKPLAATMKPVPEVDMTPVAEAAMIPLPEADLKPMANTVADAAWKTVSEAAIKPLSEAPMKPKKRFTNAPRKINVTTKKARPILETTHSSNTNIDPIVGTLLTYHCNSLNGQQIKLAFGKSWDPAAICYQLDATEGHIVGSVMCKVKGNTKKQKEMNKYDVAWEFTALGVSSLDLPIILEGHNEGKKLQAIWLQQRDNLEKKTWPSIWYT